MRIDCIAPMNLRDKLVPPVPREAVGMFVSSVPLVFRVSRGDNPWAVARRATASLALAIDREEPFILASYMQMLAGLFARLARGPHGPARLARFVEALGTPTFGLSNVGALPIKAELQPFTIEGIGFANGVGCASHFNSFASSIGGTLRWSFVWSDPIVSEERARRIVARAKAHLDAAVARPRVEITPAASAALPPRA